MSSCSLSCSVHTRLQTFSGHHLTRRTVLASPCVRCLAQAGDRLDSAAEIPSSREESIQQALSAIRGALTVEGKRKKKGMALWAGTKRLAVEVPVDDSGAAAQLELARALMAALPPEAGRPVLVLGAQAATDLARERQAPFEVYSVAECLADDEDVVGPLVLACTTREQGEECARLLDERWRGKVVLVINAGWLQDTPQELEALADSLDPVYFFLPIAFQGLFGGKTGFVFRWASSRMERALWQIFLDDGSTGIKCVGRMARKPSQADLETAVYNAAAASSPLAAGAKMFRNLAGRFSGDKK